MSETAELIDEVCNRCGTGTTDPTHFGRDMVESWLGQAQRKLAIAGPILKTYFQGTAQAGAEVTSLPQPDFIKIFSIHLRRPDQNIYRRLEPMGHISELNPDRRILSTLQTPSKYGIWAGNDSSGNNAKGLVFDKNFGSTYASPDLFIFIRQYPKDVVDGGQKPEVSQAWQDVMLEYAEMMARRRMGVMDPDQFKMAQLAKERWEAGLQEARDFEPETEDAPCLVIDRAGYTIDDEDFEVG